MKVHHAITAINITHYTARSLTRAECNEFGDVNGTNCYVEELHLQW